MKLRFCAGCGFEFFALGGGPLGAIRAEKKNAGDAPLAKAVVHNLCCFAAVENC